MNPASVMNLFVMIAGTIGLACGLTAIGQDASGKPDQPSPFHLENLPLKSVEDGVFELGEVTLDRKRRRIEFPAEVNMSSGMVEYVLVHRSGKTHESVLTTQVAPYRIHLATLLVGASPPLKEAVPGQPPPIEGEPIEVKISWEVDGKKQRMGAGALVYNEHEQAPMGSSDWIYNGSRLWKGRFIAQRDGSVVSIIEDPDALVNNLDPQRLNDEIWVVNTNIVPAIGTVVKVEWQLMPEKVSD